MYRIAPVIALALAACLQVDGEHPAPELCHVNDGLYAVEWFEVVHVFGDFPPYVVFTTTLDIEGRLALFDNVELYAIEHVDDQHARLHAAPPILSFTMTGDCLSVGLDIELHIARKDKESTDGAFWIAHAHQL